MRISTFSRSILLCGLCFGISRAHGQTPTITSFSPASGPVGTLVTITGTNLSTPTAFTIGGVAAVFVSGGSDSILGMVMPGAVTGSIAVTTSGGAATGSGNFIIMPTGHPSTQLGTKLVGTGAVDSTYGAHQGIVSISADGNTAIAGGWGDSGSIGAVWIYTRSGSTWAQQGNKLVGIGSIGPAEQGVSVALSADGNTAIVGGPVDSTNRGAVWIYTRSGSTWAQQGGKLVGTGGTRIGVNGSWQGGAVALSADGNVAIVGGPIDNNDTGAVWIFTRTGSTWAQQGSKLVGTGGVGGVGSYQGSSVALSADGNTAIVGGYLDNNQVGAVWVYTRTGSTWTQQGSKLVGTGAIGGSLQGASVALSADGNTAIVGGYGDSSGTGAVWIFTRSGTTWSQQGNKLVGTGAIGASSQGISVAISADGNTALEGGLGDNNLVGAAWEYTRSGSTWAQQGSKIVGAGAVGQSEQGNLALSSDGTTAMVGGTYDNNGIGAVWVFVDSVIPCTPDSFAFTRAICQGDTFTFMGHALTVAGTYNDTLQRPGGCDSIVSLTLSVNPLPVVSLSWDSLIGLHDLGVSGGPVDTALWCDFYFPQIFEMIGGNPAGGIYAGKDIANDTFNMQSNVSLGFDTVTYTYTDSNGCFSAATNLIRITICEGINNISTANTISLYPNPNHGSFTLETSNSIGSEYTISDMLGKVVAQDVIKQNEQVIEVKGAAEGVYTLVVKGSQAVRFVIVR